MCIYVRAEPFKLIRWSGEGIVNIISQVGQAIPISGGPIWHMHGSGDEDGQDHHHRHPADLHHGDPRKRKADECGRGPKHTTLTCQMWHEGVMKMAFNILMFIPIVRIPRSYFKDDIPFTVKVTGSARDSGWSGHWKSCKVREKWQFASLLLFSQLD